MEDRSPLERLVAWLLFALVVLAGLASVVLDISVAGAAVPQTAEPAIELQGELQGR